MTGAASAYPTGSFVREEHTLARTSKAAKKTTKSKKAASKGSSTTRKARSTTSKAAPEKAAKTTKKKAASGRVTKSTSTAKTTKKAASASTGAKKAAKRTTRAKKAKSPFDTRFLEQMRKSLASERETYVRQAAQLRAEAESLVADLDPGDVQFDEESGEGDTIAVERNRDLALASKALEMIDEIDHALGKFDGGTYGICEVSGEPIPKERLEAIPWAREKVEYKVGGFGRR